MGSKQRNMEFGWFHQVRRRVGTLLVYVCFSQTNYNNANIYLRQGRKTDENRSELEVVKYYGQENTFQVQPVPPDELANANFALQVGRECKHVLKVLQEDGVTQDTLDETVDSTKLLVEFCTDTRLKGLNFDQKVSSFTNI